jgi:hypothetical protein
MKCYAFIHQENMRFQLDVVAEVKEKLKVKEFKTVLHFRYSDLNMRDSSFQPLKCLSTSHVFRSEYLKQKTV